VDLEEEIMRIFLFKILFRLTWWIAPNKPRVNKIFELYLEYIKLEEDYIKCQQRQAEMDACVQPRTETYEFLTTKKQRELYGKLMPPRTSDSDQPRSHYSDYEEAKAYHDGT
tara:strand:- start:199 stop:534 length:336 start_codon:yes stop_codon:yes gene_type:complete